MRAERPGRRARHLQPAPPGAARRAHRRGVEPAHRAGARADGPPHARLGHLRAAQQPALRGRRARLRVRVLDRGARDARALGGPVRRLRQRRPDHDRPVHHLGPGQVGRGLAAHDAAAPRLRGQRARALLGPHGALPADGGRGQHPGRRLHDARRSTSTCCAARRCPTSCARSCSSPPRACCGCGPRPRGSWTTRRGPLPAGARRPARPTGRERVRRLLLCTGKVFYELDGHAERAGADDLASRAWSSSTRSRRTSCASCSSAYPEPDRGHLGAGGAAQHGRLELGVAAHRPAAPGRDRARLRGAPAAGQPQRGLPPGPPGRAGAHPERRVGGARTSS